MYFKSLITCLILSSQLFGAFPPNINPIKQVTPREMPSLVSEYRLNTEFINIIPILTLFNDMAYALGKAPFSDFDYQKYLSYKQYFTENGWVSYAVPGVTGKMEETAQTDAPGIVAFNKAKNLMVITFRGSQTLSGETQWNAKDWEANLDLRVTTSDDLMTANKNAIILPSDMKLSAGYAYRAAQVMSGLVGVMTSILLDNPNAPLDSMRFIVTGHSQGAAVGPIILAGLTKEFGENVYGKDYSNKKYNHFYGYFFASPRVIKSAESSKIFQDFVGKNNIVNQDGEGDIVPRFGAYLTGWRDIGFLALDKSKDIVKRLSDRLDALGIEISGPINTIVQSIATQHYGSSLNYCTGEWTKGPSFDPLLADTSGQVVAALKKIYANPKLCKSISSNTAKAFYPAKSTIDVDILLSQGKSSLLRWFSAY